MRGLVLCGLMLICACDDAVDDDFSASGDDASDDDLLDGNPLDAADDPEEFVDIDIDADTPETDGSGTPYTFNLWVPDEGSADVRTDRLCDEADDPEAAPDKVHLHCRTEGSNDLPAPSEAPTSITVMTWNIERGFHTDEIIDFFESGAIPTPDVLLASEIDRGCERTGYRDVAREIADRLGYNYIYGVEFVELPRPVCDGCAQFTTCEHGNAVFSRYPMGDASAHFHASNYSWYLPPDQRDSGEPRLGGRAFVQADLDLSDGAYLRVFSIHFESDPINLVNQLAQAAEVADLGAAAPIPTIIGGDTNNVAYFIDIANDRDDVPERVIDQTVATFISRGFVDPHRFMGSPERSTHSGLVLDLLFGSRDFWGDAEVCSPDICTTGISDHQAVWAEYRIER